MSPRGRIKRLLYAKMFIKDSESESRKRKNMTTLAWNSIFFILIFCILCCIRSVTLITKSRKWVQELAAR